MSSKKKSNSIPCALQEVVNDLLTALYAPITLVSPPAQGDYFKTLVKLGFDGRELLKAMGYDTAPSTILQGTWVRVFWNDTEPTWGILLGSMRVTKSDPDPEAQITKPGTKGISISHSQIIDIGKNVFDETNFKH